MNEENERSTRVHGVGWGGDAERELVSRNICPKCRGPLEIWKCKDCGYDAIRLANPEPNCLKKLDIG
jgi:hypothetical protein